MPRKISPLDFDHAIEVYQSGKTLAQAGAEIGVGASTLSRELERRGIEARSRKIALPVEEIVAAHLEGETVQAIAKKHGVSRRAINRCLDEAGVEARSMSEAMKIRWERMTPEQRVATTAAAHESARGRVPSEAEMLKRAATRERNGWTGRTSEGERLLDGWLRERGLAPVREQAIGRNNVDFGLGPVAVELMGGSWHAQRAAYHQERAKKILDHDRVLAFVWSTTKCPIDSRAADYVMSLVDEASRNPSILGEYRVVRGDGEVLAAGRPDDDEWTFVPAARSGLHRRPRNRS